MQFLKRVREKLAVLHLKDELLHRARQRRLLRRREEAQRDLPAGGAGAEAGDPRRDRLRPRHRRAEDRRRRRQRCCARRTAPSWSSPTTSACSTTSSRTSCTCWPTAASSRAAARNWRWNSKSTATPGSRIASRQDARPASSALQSSFARALPAALVDAPRPRRDARAAHAATRWPTACPARAAKRWKYTSLRALVARARSSPPPTRRRACDPAAARRHPRAAPGVRQRPLRCRRCPTCRACRQASSVRPLVAGAGRRRPARRGAARPAASHDADEVFARLNAALATEGALLRVAAGARIDAPLHLVFVGAPAAGDIALAPAPPDRTARRCAR